MLLRRRLPTALRAIPLLLRLRTVSYTFRTRFGTFGMCLLDVVVVASEPRVSAEKTRPQDLFDEDDLGEDDIDL